MYLRLDSQPFPFAGFTFWSTIIYFASASLVVWHSNICETLTASTCYQRDDMRVVLVQNALAHAHIVVHFLRSFTLINYCLKVRTRLKKDLQAAVSMNKRR